MGFEARTYWALAGAQGGCQPVGASLEQETDLPGTGGPQNSGNPRGKG